MAAPFGTSLPSIEFHCGPASSDSPLALSPGGCSHSYDLTSQPTRTQNLFPDRIAIIDSTNNQYHSALHAYLLAAHMWFEASHPCGKKKTHGFKPPERGPFFKRKMSTIPNSKSSIFQGICQGGVWFLIWGLKHLLKQKSSPSLDPRGGDVPPA